jgi:hypothetical protein
MKMNNANSELYSLDIDCQLLAIENLKWLPWVGNEYFDSERRILIVGESHYLTGSKSNRLEAEKLNFTLNVIQTFCIDHRELQPTFDNLNRCLFGKKSPKKKVRTEMWKQLAFYNFVQCPMETIDARPTSDDMEKGWKVFAELIKMLKPTHCIFIGFAAADCNNPYKCKRSKENVGKYYARLFSAKIDEQNTCQCIAIKHTSQYFSWRSWRKFLKEKYPDMMQYLKYLLPKTGEN